MNTSGLNNIDEVMSDKSIENLKEISSAVTIGYIPEIDGLRALAIIAVIINHFNESILPSGYLGVDIFFVISGFVITSSLTNRSERNLRKFLLSFYVRRFKRLAPALILCVVCTCILITLFNPLPNNYLKTGVSSLFGLSNFHLYLNSLDYWGLKAKLNPFTHTWSLGVEEQFYLVFPLLLWFALFVRCTTAGYRNFRWYITAIGLASLIGFSYVSHIDKAAAYFLMPFRFWELGAGCLIFLLAKENKLSGVVSGKSLQLAFIAAIIAVLFLPQELSVQATILVVILTAFLLADIQTAKKSYGILDYPIVVYIGIISYSLYLWHWVVLTISRWTIGIHWWSVPIQLGLMLLLAFVSYRYVEHPLRHARWLSSSKNITNSAIISTVLFGLLMLPLLTRNSNLLYLGTMATEGQPKTWSEWRDSNSIYPADSSISMNAACGSERFSKGNKNKKIRIIGNSHSLRIMPMLKVIAEKCDLTLITEKHPNYIVIPSGNGKDLSKLDGVIENLNMGDILILSSRNRYLYTIPYLNVSGDKWIDHSAEKTEYGYGLHTWLLELDSVINIAKQKGVNVVLFLPNVEFDSEVLPFGFICKKQWFRIPAKGCNPKVSRDFLDKRFPIEFYQEVNSRVVSNTNFFTFDPLPIYCADNKECLRTVGGVVAFSDTNHLSVDGALLMLEKFDLFLGDNHLLN
jgi:peptidoglycan/LPS O-acetylase OafA/YrhL